MSKYNRTFHFSFSPEIHSDDKTLNLIDEKNNFLQDIVITEKLDGGNACLKNGEVFARTHATPANHGSFSMLKQVNNIIKNMIPEDYEVFGENMQGIHSIKYSDLKSPFYIFNIKQGNTWLSLKDLEDFSSNIGIPLAPLIFKGSFQNINELQIFLEEEIKKPSLLGGEREGFVIRPARSFNEEEFPHVVGKYVRSGHVQTDKHWSTNWKEARIDPRFWDNLMGYIMKG